MTRRQRRKFQQARRRSHAIRKAANISRRNEPKCGKPLPLINNMPMVTNRATSSWLAMMLTAISRRTPVAGIMLCCLWLAGCTPFY